MSERYPEPIPAIIFELGEYAIMGMDDVIDLWEEIEIAQEDFPGVMVVFTV